MTMTSTYDHRIIQGAESGRFLARIEEYLQGERGFYERRLRARSASSSARLRAPPAPAAAASAAARSAGHAAPVGGEELLQAVQAASTLVSRVPQPRPPRGAPRPARLRARGRPGARPRGARADARRSMAQLPAKIFQHVRARRDARRRAAAPARDLLRHDRLRDRAHRLAPPARVAARAHRVRRVPRAADQRRARARCSSRLVEVDALERFMHKAYLGQHQFSIEGLDMTVPMLDELIQLSAAHGGQEVVVGMAHRGRLNVLAHNLGRPYDTIFARVRGRLDARGGHDDPAGRHRRRQVPPRHAGLLPAAGRGDDPRQPRVQPEPPRVRLPGRRGRDARGADHRARARTPHQDTDAAVPIVIHGDASFPAQGVVSETLNLQALDGYKVGGTVHLITNNQVGFTTDPDDARSTRWASDLAKGFDVPIIHVNADDVQACIERGAARVRLPPGVRPRRADRPDRLPPLRPQRVRRARVHAAGDVREDQGQEARRRAVGATAWSPRASSRRRRSSSQAQEVWDNLTLLHQRLKAKIAAAAEHEGEHTTGRVPARPLAEPRGRDGGARRAPARARRGSCCACPRASRSTRSSSNSSSAGARRSAERASANIDWAHAEALAFASLLDRGHADPPDRPGHRARHVQPAPHGPARREDRPDRLPDPEPARRAGAARAAQQPAVGARVHGLRVRLQPGGAGDARAVGGAVRRLRQLRRR